MSGKDGSLITECACMRELVGLGQCSWHENIMLIFLAIYAFVLNIVVIMLLEM